MDRTIFNETTDSRWYDQGIWELINDGAFVNRLNRYARPEANEAHQFRLDLVMLDSRGNNGLSITKDHFQSLLQKFEIPESSVESLFHRDGRFTHSVEPSGAEPYSEGTPDSLLITMQTPSLEFNNDNTNLPLDSIAVLLQISAQRSYATCIIITEGHIEDKDLARPFKIGDGIASALHRNYDLIRSCPFQIMNIIFGQLDSLNERYWNAREHAFFKLRTNMEGFCTNTKALYDDDGMAIFSFIHSMNILRRKLIPLDYALEFELSALHYIQVPMETYQKMQKDGNRTQFPRRVLETFNQKVRYLETAAKLRQKRREGLEEWARLNVDILRSSNAQHDTKLTLDDSIAVKTISFVTLIFLPVSVVATISGSNAFDVENRNIGNGVKVWNNWWILLIIAVCLTGVVVTGGLLYWRKRRNNARHFTDSDHGQGKGACPILEIGQMET
ncbi:hypothetical protein F4781DRAFT_431660 [Annulohypoxylon bovei var. microspora]|nr:hypothetical protein F4781DRAFT_431660 [Annulohypoxylon bovei var. microspora]